MQITALLSPVCGFSGVDNWPISLFPLSATNSDRASLLVWLKSLSKKPNMPAEVISSLAAATFFVSFDFYDGILTWMIKGKN